jgi:hypothetical protein
MIISTTTVESSRTHTSKDHLFAGTTYISRWTVRDNPFFLLVASFLHLDIIILSTTSPTHPHFLIYIFIISLPKMATPAPLNRIIIDTDPGNAILYPYEFIC